MTQPCFMEGISMVTKHLPIIRQIMCVCMYHHNYYDVIINNYMFLLCCFCVCGDDFDVNIKFYNCMYFCQLKEDITGSLKIGKINYYQFTTLIICTY